MDTPPGTEGAPLSRSVKLKESLASLIRTQGYTGRQKEIAEAIGVSDAALSHYVNGRSTPSFDKLLALAGFFDVSLDYLVYGDVSPSAMTHLPNEYISRQVQSALNESNHQAARRQDLVARLAMVMVRSLEDAVNDVVALPPPASDGTSARSIINADAVLLEEHADQVRIVSSQSVEDTKTGRHSGTTIVTADGESKPGPFLHVQASNLRKGRPYHQIVQGPKAEWSGRAKRIRASLSGAGVTREQLDALHLMRGSTQPVLGTVVLLTLRDQLDDPQARIVYEKVRGYIRTDGLFVYISIMDDLFKGGIPLAATYRDAAERIFDEMWSNGVIL